MISRLGDVSIHINSGFLGDTIALAYIWETAKRYQHTLSSPALVTQKGYDGIKEFYNLIITPLSSKLCCQLK